MDGSQGVMFNAGDIVEMGLSGWAGTHWTKVRVVGATATRYRISPVSGESVKLPRKTIEGTQTALVPKYAVRACR